MLLKIDRLTKKFGTMYALKDVCLEVEKGEIHALVGENGAGKSTLIKILTGVYTKDEGDIFWEDDKIRIENPNQVRNFGMNVIHQDRNLIPAFKGVENVYLGLEYPKKNGKISWKEMEEAVRSIMEELGIEFPLNVPAKDLTPPQKTMVEIVRALMVNCKLLILDEPTAALTDKETEILFHIIHKLKNKGTSIIYISHRLEEIFRLSDRITVLKNGNVVKTLSTSSTNRDELISLMTDNWKKESEDVERYAMSQETILKVEGLSSADQIVKNVSFTLNKGEILGVFGLAGAGRTEMLECIYGIRKKANGIIKMNGESFDKISPALSIKKGMVLICEDRRGMGIVANMSVRKNVTLSSIKDYMTLGVFHNKKEKQAVTEKIDELSIKTAGMNQEIGQLSGGNQQKVVFAKALMTEPIVYLCDEPTQAVDVKTRAEIHRLLREKAIEGKAVVFVSSDLNEVLEVATRIIILRNGELVASLDATEITSEEVLRHCYAEKIRSENIV